MSISYHSHTADVRMLIKANSLEDLFAEGVKGMGNILKDSFCTEPHKFDKKISIEVQASDRTNLLIDFLSDVLSNSCIEKVICCHLEIIDFSENRIKAELFCSNIDQFDEEIKAVTYHEANIIKNKKGDWETSIIFDI